MIHNIIRDMKWITFWLITTIFLMAGCAPIKERMAVRHIRLKFTGVEIASIDFQGVTLNLHWKGYNPNPVDAVLDGFETDIFANGVKIGHARTLERIRIPARESRKIVVPLKLKWKNLSKPIQDGIRNKNLRFRAVGFAIMNTPLGRVRFKVTDKTANVW